MNDTERLNFLQKMTKGFGKGWIFRDSTTGRGFRLHESDNENAVNDVRKAIDNFHERHGLSLLEKKEEGLVE